MIRRGATHAQPLAFCLGGGVSLSPAKATRPGFRQSMGPGVDSQRADQAAINLFHPVYHAFTYPIGCRVDIERLLPVELENEDHEELIDNFSEPPVWLER